MAELTPLDFSVGVWPSVCWSRPPARRACHGCCRWFAVPPFLPASIPMLPHSAPADTAPSYITTPFNSYIVTPFKFLHRSALNINGNSSTIHGKCILVFFFSSCAIIGKKYVKNKKQCCVGNNNNNNNTKPLTPKCIPQPATNTHTRYSAVYAPLYALTCPHVLNPCLSPTQGCAKPPLAGIHDLRLRQRGHGGYSLITTNIETGKKVSSPPSHLLSPHCSHASTILPLTPTYPHLQPRQHHPPPNTYIVLTADTPAPSSP